MYWMIANRNVEANGLGDDFADMTYWRNDSGNLQTFPAWTNMNDAEFRQALVQVADAFPDLAGTAPEDQKHVSLFVHGFDNTWGAAAQQIVHALPLEHGAALSEGQRLQPRARQESPPHPRKDHGLSWNGEV